MIARCNVELLPVLAIAVPLKQSQVASTTLISFLCPFVFWHISIFIDNLWPIIISYTAGAVSNNVSPADWGSKIPLNMHEQVGTFSTQRTERAFHSRREAAIMFLFLSYAHLSWYMASVGLLMAHKWKSPVTDVARSIREQLLVLTLKILKDVYLG